MWSGSCSGRFTANERASVTGSMGEYVGLRASQNNLGNIHSLLAKVCSNEVTDVECVYWSNTTIFIGRI